MKSLVKHNMLKSYAISSAESILLSRIIYEVSTGVRPVSNLEGPFPQVRGLASEVFSMLLRTLLVRRNHMHAFILQFLNGCVT